MEKNQGPNILLVSTRISGGAGLSCLRLFEALKEKSVNVKILTLENEIPEMGIYCVPPEIRILREKKGLYLFLSKLVRKNRSSGLTDLGYPEGIPTLHLHPLIQWADVIHLHWVAGFVDYYSFFKSCKKPMVWTFHDMWPIMGVNHCEEYYFGLDTTGRLKQRRYKWSEIILENLVKKRKRNALVNSTVKTIVAPSEWLLNKAIESGFFPDCRIIRIQHATQIRQFSTNFICPWEKSGFKVLIFIADKVSWKLKGTEVVEKIIPLLPENVKIVTIGSGKVTGAWMNLGFIQNAEHIRFLLSKSVLVLVPSFEENYPQVITEAHSVGIPVVSFFLAGQKELIQDGLNGFSSKNFSVQGFLEIILRALDHPFDKDTIIQLARKRPSQQEMAELYILEYQKIFA